MLAAGTIGSFGLYLARTSALVLGAPLLGQAIGFSGVRVGLIVALAGVMYLVTGSPLPSDPGALGYGVMLLREILIGAFLAFLSQLVILGGHVAGELVGQEMGFNMAGQIDPETGVQTHVVPRFYEVFLLLGLMMLDAHHCLIRALADSFVRAPIGDLGLSRGIAPFVLRFFVQSFAAGIAFAAPCLILLFVASALLGLMARLVPQLNVMEIGFIVRISLALFALWLFSPLLAPLVERVSRGLSGGLSQALDLLAT